jgi:hypothetical protein
MANWMTERQTLCADRILESEMKRSHERWQRLNMTTNG